MPYYSYLRQDFRSKADRKRVVENLETLRAQLDREVPGKDQSKNLLLATWNIRDFGKKNRRGFGKRLDESHYYIAEIISRFDFIAVQEVNELAEWRRVMKILGSNWDYLANDVADRSSGGNGERMMFVYDRRKVRFQNIAGEIVLPSKMLISGVDFEVEGEDGKTKKFRAGKQFRRTPFVASFQSGWFKFDICTVHIYYGTDSGPKLNERVEEIAQIAKYLGKRADAELKNGRALILLGDFNIVRPGHKTMEALVNNGFTVPKPLDRTNVKDTKFYDQIAFKTKPAVVEYTNRKGNGGVFKIFEEIMTDSAEDFDQFQAAAKKSSNGKDKTGDDLKKYYETWRTYQLSDHRPLWVRLVTDDSAAYLERLKNE